MENIAKKLTYEEALKQAKERGETVVPTTCGMCGPGGSGGCGIYAFAKDGKFVRVAGMAESPGNQGGLCAKAHAAPEWVYAPERLTTPLKRVGKKGEGRFEPISWDEAIDIIAEKLLEQKEKYGAKSLAMLSPARRGYSEYMQRFLNVHGSPNYGHSGICMMQRMFSFSYTIGSMTQADYARANVILVWGRQPFYAGPAMPPAKAYLGAVNRDAKVVAIKPSVEADSGMADIWVPVRPGTDSALALSMLHVIINEDLIDHEFVEKWCYGFEPFKAHVQQYTPEWGEKVTGVPAQQIIDIARMYATEKCAAIDVGNGLEHSPSSSDAFRAIGIMMAITGHLDRPGCNLFGGPMGGGGKKVDQVYPYTEEFLDQLVAPEFPRFFQPFLEGPSSAYYKILESVLTEEPYPIRAIISPGTQPGASTRGTKKVLEALEKLDFYVVVDVTKTADMDYADIVIPTTTVYEADYPFDAKGNCVMAHGKVIEPLGDYKSIYDFFFDLAVRMGYGKDFWDGSIEKWQDDMLSPYGITWEELKQYPMGKKLEGKPMQPEYEKYDRIFKRPSTRLDGGPFLPQGKVAIYNTLFEEQGFAPMPEWREPPESLTKEDGLSQKYPLMLSDYHTSKAYSASWQRNVGSLRQLMPDPTIHIHPETAKARGIAHGDWVKVESPNGWLKVKAEYYPGIRPDTVMMLHGWWQGSKKLGVSDMPLTDGGANVNHLYSVTADAFDPLITAMSSQTLVEVSKYEE
ncbi:MAG: molybdopterin-dependent oxidoreductase [Agathobacter sp.]|nr:molybdopterin-dependent oxidoreductase [Agathobacter sp.]